MNSLRIECGDSRTALAQREEFERTREEREKLYREQFYQQRKELENVAADELQRAIKDEAERQAERLGKEYRDLLQGLEKGHELDGDGEAALNHELHDELCGRLKAKEAEASDLDDDCSDLLASLEELSNLAEGLHR